MHFLEALGQKRKTLLGALEANRDDISLDIFDDFYPDKAHFIYELLQNAEDAQATKVSFRLSSTKLTFEHNGRPFEEDDVRAITGIGFSTKRADVDTIGRFGIGFKAVFLYTASPRIWSPRYSFDISDMVLPSEIPPNSSLGNRTRFEFPFNSRKKPQIQAFSEVQDGLNEISNNTLLFLTNIEEIQWRIDHDREGQMLRIPHTDHHIEILREIGGKQSESKHFLRFTELVDGLERQHAAVAFELESVSGSDTSTEPTPIARLFRIAPSDRGCVAVYFTAAKETSNLRFHLHAPFVPEISRSSVKATPANTPLFAQLAGLVAKSLSSIRDLGLLDREFLAVLPNSRDEIPGQYAPIRDAIVDAMNQRVLTPTHTGGHAPAGRLLQAEAGLKDLLDREDIHFLVDTDNDPRDWAVAATQRSSRVDRFLHDLDIDSWGVRQFVKVLSERFSYKHRLCTSTYIWKQGPDRPFLDWMLSKPVEWHRALYALFHRELAGELYRFDQICIVRRSDGEYGLGSKSYFPTPETHECEDAIHPRVAEGTYAGGGTKAEQTNAKAFLKGIGVREVGEFQQVEAILKHQYQDPTRVPPWHSHQSDLKRFIALTETDQSASNLFKDYFIFQGSNRLGVRPSELYLDEPFLDTGLKAYYGHFASEADRTALSDVYRTFDMRPRLIEFAQMCGATDRLEIAKVSCTDNPESGYLLSAPGSFRTQTGVDTDFAIPNLGTLFETPRLALSRLVWNALSDRAHDKYILRATFQKNQSNCPYSADSQLVHQLRSAAWVPQRGDVFVHPAMALRDLLPEGFPFDPYWAWLEAIGFGAETETRAAQLNRNSKIAAELGFRDEAALEDGKQFAELAPDTRQRILAELKSQVNLPIHEPRNPDRRAESVRKNARQAPERRTERRERSVSVNRDPTKREKTVPYLREIYSNADGTTICQACKNRLPFRLADGTYFFEAVEFLPGLLRHHYQNYLALCPNHASMFTHANPSRGEMKNKFLSLVGNELPLSLADQPVTVYFTDTHIADLRVVIGVDVDY